jgi:hypothetical protein
VDKAVVDARKDRVVERGDWHLKKAEIKRRSNSENAEHGRWTDSLLWKQEFESTPLQVCKSRKGCGELVEDWYPENAKITRRSNGPRLGRNKTILGTFLWIAFNTPTLSFVLDQNV